MPLTLNTRVQLLPDQSSSSVLGNETILLNYRAGNYYELNEVGGFIWSLLQDKKSLMVHEIQAQLLDEFDVEPAICQDELMLFLDNLLHEKLIDVSE